MQRRTALIAAAVVVGAAGWYAFRPERLFIDKTVNESLAAEVAAPANAPAAGATMAAAPAAEPATLARGTFHSNAHETNGTATVHFKTRDFVTDDAALNSAQLNAGGVIACVPLPWEGATYERYLGILVTVTTTDTTAGTINAFLTTTPAKWQAYPDAL